MAHEDEENRRRIVIDQPPARREVREYVSRDGSSTATIAVLVVVAVAVVVLFLLLIMNRQASDNANMAASQPTPAPQTTIIEQPAQQPPVIVQQPAAQPATQPPVAVNPPLGSSGSTANTTDDSTVQAAVDKKLQDDPNLASQEITATVLDGKVTLTGMVKSEAMKDRVEKEVRAVKGVRRVDNKLTIATT